MKVTHYEALRNLREVVRQDVIEECIQILEAKMMYPAARELASALSPAPQKKISAA